MQRNEINTSKAAEIEWLEALWVWGKSSYSYQMHRHMHAGHIARIACSVHIYNEDTRKTKVTSPVAITELLVITVAV